MKATFLKFPIIKISLFAALIGGMVSCDNNATTTDKDTKEVAEDANEAKFDSSKNEQDAQFLVNAAEINMEEIKLGQLAQQRASSADVKNFAKMMVEGHTKALSDLKGLAQTKQVSLPDSTTKDGLDHYGKLDEEKNGSDFDRKYCDMMVDAHKDAIDRFERAAGDNNADAQIKQWASSMIPDLRSHLDQALTCQNKLQKNNSKK